MTPEELTSKEAVYKRACRLLKESSWTITEALFNATNRYRKLPPEPSAEDWAKTFCLFDRELREAFHLVARARLILHGGLKADDGYDMSDQYDKAALAAFVEEEDRALEEEDDAAFSIEFWKALEELDLKEFYE